MPTPVPHLNCKQMITVINGFLFVIMAIVVINVYSHIITVVNIC